MLLRVNNGVGDISIEYAPENSATLCDGRTHSVAINKKGITISLDVDGTSQEKTGARGATSADTYGAPFYVGGLPGTTN